MALLILGLCVFGWWAQRDAYRTGIEAGRLRERGEAAERELLRQQRERGEHLRVVR